MTWRTFTQVHHTAGLLQKWLVCEWRLRAAVWAARRGHEDQVTGSLPLVRLASGANAIKGSNCEAVVPKVLLTFGEG